VGDAIVAGVTLGDGTRACRCPCHGWMRPGNQSAGKVYWGLIIRTDVIEARARAGKCSRPGVHGVSGSIGTSSPVSREHSWGGFH
jgi:hypothetical protein